MFEGISRWDPFKKRRTIDQLLSGSSYNEPTYTYPSSHYRGSDKLTEESIAKLAKLKDSQTEDWPSKLKDTEWALKYPPEKELPPEKKPESDTDKNISKENMPDKKKTEEGDSTATMPELKKTEEGNPTATMPAMKSTWEVDFTATMPAKKTSGNYEYPKIEIDGEDKKLFNLFKKMPMD